MIWIYVCTIVLYWHSDFIEETVEILKEKLRSYKMTIAETAEITNLLCETDAPIPPETKDACLSLVSSCSTNESASETKGNPKFQAHGNIENYLTDDDWQCLRDPRVPVTSKVSRMIIL